MLRDVAETDVFNYNAAYINEKQMNSMCHLACSRESIENARNK